MPIGFLTAADRTRLNRFPEQIPHEDLSAFFLLSEADQQAINQQHSEAHTRLGFALQLCALRYLGFAPDDLTTAPPRAVEYVAQQLGVAPQALTAYGTRRPTRTTDFQHVQAHLHFRLATPLDMYALQTWLGERALEHDKPPLCYSNWPVTSSAGSILSARGSPAWNASLPQPASRPTTRRGAG
jgi:hypothetical protein